MSVSEWYEWYGLIDRYPVTIEDFEQQQRLMSQDDWDLHIRCVVDGVKSVAMTDYDELLPASQHELDEYYTATKQKDLVLRSSPGLNVLTDKTGTRYWFRSEYQRWAQLLVDHYNETRLFPTRYNEIIRSILLGYSMHAIVLYHVYQESLSRDTPLTQQTYEAAIYDVEHRLQTSFVKAAEWINKMVV